MAEKARVGVLISGRGSNMAALLYASRAERCPYEIVLVASNDPDAAGLALAKAEGVKTWAQSHKGMKRAEFDALVDSQLRKARVSHVALAGYMRLLSPEFVGRWEGRMVNIHPSLLPAYKGLDTHQRALDAGDSMVGCSVHLVTAELDDGPVLGQTRVAVMPGDTAETLAARVLIAEHQLYPHALADLVSRESSPEWLLSEVRRRAMALPVSEEGMTHGMHSFRIDKGRRFAYFTQNLHGDGRIGLLVKTSAPEEQALLIEHEPDIFYRPAYFGAMGWVGIRLDQEDLDWEMVEQRLLDSWRQVAPKKLALLV